MNEPKLRFPEFKDIWNNHKIEDMFDRVGTPVDLDDTLTYREIGIRSHGKGIFHKDETTASEIGNKRIFWVKPDCFVVNIVFAWERAVAKTTEAENGMIASHRFPMYKPKKDVVDLDYITEYFITKRGQNVLILASPGGAGRNKTLGQKEFAKSVVKLPSLPEQQKIAEFLSTIDTVIGKQKETVSAWEERKKGVMQKLFSQEVRFKADDGSEFPDWEEKKLSELFKKIIEKNRLDLPALTIIQGSGTIRRDESERRITYDEKGLKNYKAVQKNDFIVHLRSFEGGLEIANQDGIVSPAYHVYRGNDEVNPLFYYPYFRSSNFINGKLSICVTGVRDGKNIEMSSFDELLIPYPCLAEQQKIADCLSSLDDVIEKQKATLAAWEEMKKGLLQQMFV